MENFTLKKGYRLIERTIQQALGWTYEDYHEQFLKDTADTSWLREKDWFWGLLNRLVIETKGNPMVHHHQAVFVNLFEGKPGTPYDKLCIEAGLLNDIVQQKDVSIALVTEIVTNGARGCSYALKVHGKKYPIDINNLNPAELAGEKCTWDRCLCFYSVLPKRDQDGDLIWK
ncbi:MAG: hypothetical protein ABJJ25_13935 [Eudoraea sp.]|uniref:hypothetical protein n=1 Tax=Eudoraea sp. TaxID=1979955 RepID=UPI00326469DC